MPVLRSSGVYKIKHLESGRVYIGSAVNLAARIKNHRSKLNCGHHINQKLQRAWSKYGPAAFSVRVLLVCSKADLLMFEQLCLDGYRAAKDGFNICPTAGNVLGRKHSEATKAKMRESAIRRGVPAEHIARMAAANQGRVLSAESRAKVSSALKQRVRKPDTFKKISAALKADWAANPEKRIQSPEKKARIAASMREVWRTRKTNQQEEANGKENQ